MIHFMSINNTSRVWILLLLNCTILSLPSIIAQNKEAIPKKIITDYSNDKAELLLEEEVPKKYKETFAADNAMGKFRLSFYHNVYYNQPILEEYIRSILMRLDPENPELETIDIYITPQTQFNAFTIADGSVFINIASLADMKSEAELAYLLGHEYGHYKFRHVRQSYVIRRKNGMNQSQREHRQSAEFSQALELQADSAGYRMAYDAGYDSRAMDQLLQRLLFLQKRGFLLRYKQYDSQKVTPTSHPVGEERLLQIKKLNTESNNGLMNPSGEERFENIKRLAEFEYLKALDESSDLLSAMSFPLKMFLKTGDKKFLPVMVRAVRKAMLLVPDIEKMPFMTGHFADREERFDRKENIFTNLYLEYPDSVEVKEIYAQKAVDFEKINHMNYEQAFTFFAELAAEEGYQEPLLDIALHFSMKSAKGRNAVNEYLKKENNLYHDYAQKLKDKKLISSLQNGESVVLYGGVHNYTFKKKWVYPDHDEFFESRHEELAKLRARYDKHELDYKIYDYMDFIQKYEMGRYLSTIENLIYSGYSSKILDYDPRIYYALKQANIASLEYMQINHYYIRKRMINKLFLIPTPYTVYLTYLWIRAPYLFAEHVSTAHYYRLGLTEKEVVGITNGDIKTGWMTKKRGRRITYKLHKKTRKKTQ